MDIETLWHENWVTLIDGKETECSLNAVVDPEDESILYIVEKDGEIEDFRTYQLALEDFIRKSHSNLMKEIELG